jgi:hypothetical protein
MRSGADDNTIPDSVAISLEALETVTSVVLVEGRSDQAAVLALAGKLGRDLEAEGTAVVAIGGATNAGYFLETLGPNGRGLRLAGLCDAAEVKHFLRGLARAGMGSASTSSDLERRGFFVCDPDLEGEMIRALGPTAVAALFESQGELGPFRTFKRQPAQRDRSIEDQLHRFLGTQATRKVRYGSLLIETLAIDQVPTPLLRLLAHISS